jgi:hypothetical protein
MAENEAGTPAATPEAAPKNTTNEVALELMKFIAVTTGYGKTSHSGTGFSSKPQSNAAEDQAEALLGLFERCRKVVKKED